MSPPILVTGATGNTGGATVEALRSRGVPVRAVSRSPREWPDGVESVVGDLDDAGTLTDAARGVAGAYLLSGYSGLEGLLAALADGGTQRVTLLSSSAAPSGSTTNAVAAYHVASEQLVRDSRLAWTILQPNTFMTNALNWRDELAAGNVVHGPFGDCPVAMNDPADIAQIAALALATGELDGQTLRLSGPEALLPADQLRILGEALGRPLRFEGWDDDEARRELVKQMPEAYVDAFFEIFRGGLADEATVHPTIEQLLGRPPRSFAEWTRAHAADFAA